MWKKLFAFCLFVFAGSAYPATAQNQEDDQGKATVYTEDFNSYKDGELPRDWWVEGGQEVCVQNGHLFVKADPQKRKGPGYVATVWLRKRFSGDIRVEFDAHVLSSTLDVNNINFFLYYSDPRQGATMYGTRDQRPDGLYSYYHILNGYVFTYLKAPGHNGGKARFRMRRCPGFELIDQNFAYQNRRGKTYHITVSKSGDRLTFAVDGKVYMAKEDKKYNWKKGIIGFRTFHTTLWFDNLKVERLSER